MEKYTSATEPQKIAVFQQNGSGENKIRGIAEYGGERFVIERFDIDESLPGVIDDTDEYLPETLDADIVLDYLVHPDLSTDLSALCKGLGIPVVASRKKVRNGWTKIPPVCCALKAHPELGAYGRMFGAPALETTVADGVVRKVKVSRGAPCGATWEAAGKIEGMPVSEAAVRFGLETQFFCKADPSGWEVIGGKSPVHLAAELHEAVLEKAISPGGEDENE